MPLDSLSVCHIKPQECIICDLDIIIILLYDWRESCLLIGSTSLHKSLCLPVNRYKLTYKLILQEN